MLTMILVGIKAQNLSIDECRNLAIENNNQLKNARLEIKASKETKKEAFTKYFPSVSGNAMAVNANTSMVKADIVIPNLGELPDRKSVV